MYWGAVISHYLHIYWVAFTHFQYHLAEGFFYIENLFLKSCSRCCNFFFLFRTNNRERPLKKYSLYTVSIGEVIPEENSLSFGHCHQRYFKWHNWWPRASFFYKIYIFNLFGTTKKRHFLQKVNKKLPKLRVGEGG